MRYSHGAALAKQQQRHRLADDVRTPDHHRLFARQFAELRLQQFEAAKRRARDEAVEPGCKPAGIHGMEAVDVLVGRNPGDDHPLVDLLGEGKLNEDSVDCRVGVERFDQPNQLVLARGGG